MSRQPIDKIAVSIIWGAILGVFLPLYLGAKACIWVDQFIALPKPFVDPTNLFFAGVLWTIFSPLFIVSGYYIIKYGGGSPNPHQVPPLNLVKEGPFKYIRHPMNLAYTFLILGLVIYLNSFAAIFILFPALALLYCKYDIASQEKYLVKQFGEEYLEYKNKTPSFIPKIK